MRRIILFGPPLAGKRTAIEEFASNGNLQMNRFGVPADQSDRSKIQRTADGQIVYATSDNSLALGPLNVGVFVSVERYGYPTVVLTLSGGVWTTALWDYYLSSADGVGLMLDSQDTCIDINCEYIDKMEALPAIPRVGCVIWTKQDLTHQRALHKQIAQRLQRSRCTDWPVFLSSEVDKPSLVKPIDWLIDRKPQPG